MASRRSRREMTVEEYHAWSTAQSKFEAIAEQTGEGGGPSLSMVPTPEQNIAWPTDLLAPETEAQADPAITAPIVAPEGDPAADNEGPAPDQCSVPAPVPAPVPVPVPVPNLPVSAMPFDGVELPASRRLAGWSALRQRTFLATLAETGSVHLASSEARLSARSAYQLRTRSLAFAAAWNVAIKLSVGRLMAIVVDRAINGRVEQIFRDGELIGERRVPSDRMLTWLLPRLDPKSFALPSEQRGDYDPQAEAVAAFPGLLDGLADVTS